MNWTIQVIVQLRKMDKSADDLISVPLSGHDANLEAYFVAQYWKARALYTAPRKKLTLSNRLY